jgi:ferric enterobactin receptor
MIMRGYFRKRWIMAKLSSNVVFAVVLLLSATAVPVHGHAEEGASKAKTLQSIRGTVADADGLPLPGAVLRVKGTLIQTLSDDLGHFILSGIPAGQWIVVASLSPFESRETVVHVNPGEDLDLEVRLDLAPLDYQVTVRSDLPKLMDASQNIGVVTVSPVHVATLPSLGEKDLFRSLQLMPGISASNEASAGLYVRGGTPDQNLVLFDGFTVYNVNHFFGIFSAFNAQAVDNITMHKGGFGSKYGGRISSVIELDGRSGNREEVAIGGGASLLSYNGYTEVPLGSNGSLLFAGRRSFQSPLSDRIRDSYNRNPTGRGMGLGGAGGFAVQPESTFYDVNARLVYDIGRRDHLTLSFYKGEDNLDSSRTMNLPGGFGNQTRPISGEIINLTQWGNTGASLGWFHQWGDNFSSSMVMAYSRYFKDRDRRSTMVLTDPDTEEETTTERGSAESNRLRDASFTFNNALTFGFKHLVEFGAQATRNDIGYLFTVSEADAGMDRHQQGTQYSLYLQDRWSPFFRLVITPGVRATYFDRLARTYLEPRLSLMAHATDRLRFKAAGGLYRQYAKNLVREDVLQGDQDFWTLADGETLPVSSSVHAIAGMTYETPSYLFDMEIYRKELRGLAEFGSMRLGRVIFGPPGQTGLPPGANTGPIDFTRLFFLGDGKAEGAEFLIQKKFGEHAGWLTYSLGRVRHFFPELSTVWYPASHDSTHELKLIDSWRYRMFTISGAWVFATGKAFTAPIGVEVITLPNERVIAIPQFGDKNASRLPDYHRLDLSISRDLYVGETNKVNAGVSIFNAYNRQNVWRREYDAIEKELIPTDINYLSWTLSAFINFDVVVPSVTRRAGPVWKTSPSGSSGGREAGSGSTGKTGKARGRVYDFLGTVEQMTGTSLIVDSKWGQRTLLLGQTTITGDSHYEPGTPVRVYYKEEADEQYLVTMVFRVVK